MQEELDPTWPVQPRPGVSPTVGRRSRAAGSHASQPRFPGWKEPRSEALIFALHPTETAKDNFADATTALRIECGLRGRPIHRQRLHLSLLGWAGFREVPDEFVRRVIDAARSVDMPSFEIGFDEAMSFQRNDDKLAFVLRATKGVSEVNTLARRIGERMRAAGLLRGSVRPIVPHVTMLYDVCDVPRRPVPPIRWTVDRFVLIHSLRGRSIHKQKGGWDLAGTG